MTFEHAQSLSSPAPASAVWALWNDPATWPEWDPSVEAVDLDPGVVAGATGSMTLGGGIAVSLDLDIVEPGRRYLGRLTMGELVIRIDHVVVDTEGGCEVTVSTVIEGPGADDIGPLVTQEAPAAMARLVALAEDSL